MCETADWGGHLHISIAHARVILGSDRSVTSTCCGGVDIHIALALRNIFPSDALSRGVLWLSRAGWRILQNGTLRTQLGSPLYSRMWIRAVFYN